MILIILLLLVPLSLTQDPCSSSTPNQYSSWMGDLYNKTKNSQTWGSRRLNEILIGGSHDAGMWKIVSKSGLGVFFPDNTYLTQSRDLIGQLCSGARWFDIRLTYFGGQWVLYHGISDFVSYGENVNTIISQVMEFLSFPKYSREIVFWRIKIGSGDSNDIANYLRSQLTGFIVDNRGNRSLPGLTLSEIWQQRTVGNLVFMEYGWNSPPVVPGQNLGWFWNYKESQWGAFTDATNLPNMLTRCTYGQFPRLLEYKAEANHTGPEHPLIGLWWTFSTGNVQENTNLQWRNYPTGLNDFYTLNGGEIGNFLLVDFFGDQSDVMKIMWDYNNNKYGISPPLPPDFGYSVQSTLPGSGMISGNPTCVSINSAIDDFTRNSIIVFVVVLVVILGFCIGCCVGFAMCIKKKREGERIEAEVYVEMGLEYRNLNEEFI